MQCTMHDPSSWVYRKNRNPRMCFIVPISNFLLPLYSVLMRFILKRHKEELTELHIECSIRKLWLQSTGMESVQFQTHWCHSIQYSHYTCQGWLASRGFISQIYYPKAGNTSSCPLILQLILQLLQLNVWCPIATVAEVPGVTGFSRDDTPYIKLQELQGEWAAAVTA